MRAPAPRPLSLSICLSCRTSLLYPATFHSALSSYLAYAPLRMPKNNKKGKVATPKAAEDFDDMLADFRLADITNPITSPSPPATTSRRSRSGGSSRSSSMASSVLPPSGPAIGRTVPDEDMVQAAILGDVKQLKVWARQGVRVSTALPLCQAAAWGQLDAVRLLVNGLGADVNLGDERGRTPLYIAAQEGQLEVSCCLVKELGADVNLGDEDGCTPLSAAAQEGHTAMARYLVQDLGAHVDKASLVGKTPLFIAVLNGHMETSRCLVTELGADVKHATHSGNTPCHAASFTEDVRMLHFLVKELGADVNKSDQQGFTPLLTAIQEGHLRVARGLIEDLGADINKATRDGRTPLMVASHGGHTKIVHLLTKCGADAQASAPSFGTAADISKAFGAPAELTEYLEAKMHCSKPGCGGAGIKKCTGCKQARYCGQACQLAHWWLHKAECKAYQAKGGKGK